MSLLKNSSFYVSTNGVEQAVEILNVSGSGWLNAINTYTDTHTCSVYIDGTTHQSFIFPDYQGSIILARFDESLVVKSDGAGFFKVTYTLD